uniref:glycoside hydrolase family 19 protein n=1 Tax=Campylobacter concisus TaxID=199 RepID=UPI001900CAA0
ILQEMVDELNRRDDDDGIQMYVKYKLDTRNRLEHFFGQCAVEVESSFPKLTESLDYSVEGLMGSNIGYFKNNYDRSKDIGRIKDKKGKIIQKANQEAIANLGYADENRPKDLRLGNTEEGDGWKYRGRGIIQITGREIYTEFNKFAHKVKLVGDEVSFVDNPELVAENKTFAFVSAAFFWAKKKNIYDKADKSKPELDNEEIVNRVTDLVNGGANKESRTKRINSYKRIREANIFKKFK